MKDSGRAFGLLFCWQRAPHIMPRSIAFFSIVEAVPPRVAIQKRRLFQTSILLLYTCHILCLLQQLYRDACLQPCYIFFTSLLFCFFLEVGEEDPKGVLIAKSDILQETFFMHFKACFWPYFAHFSLPIEGCRQVCLETVQIKLACDLVRAASSHQNWS